MQTYLNLPARIINMEKILSSHYSKKDKIIHALNELSGLNLSQLKAHVKRKLEHNLVKLNEILQLYDIKTVDDYSKIKESHLDIMIGSLRTICLIQQQ